MPAKSELVGPFSSLKTALKTQKVQVNSRPLDLNFLPLGNQVTGCGQGNV